MKTIYKYVLYPSMNFYMMPEGAKILKVDAQEGDICLWAEVDPNAMHASRRIETYGTGVNMPADPGEYLGTVLLENGQLVFHVYDAT